MVPRRILFRCATTGTHPVTLCVGSRREPESLGEIKVKAGQHRPDLSSTHVHVQQRELNHFKAATSYVIECGLNKEVRTQPISIEIKEIYLSEWRESCIVGPLCQEPTPPGHAPQPGKQVAMNTLGPYFSQLLFSLERGWRK